MECWTEQGPTEVITRYVLSWPYNLPCLKFLFISFSVNDAMGSPTGYYSYQFDMPITWEEAGSRCTYLNAQAHLARPETAADYDLVIQGSNMLKS